MVSCSWLVVGGGIGGLGGGGDALCGGGDGLCGGGGGLVKVVVVA